MIKAKVTKNIMSKAAISIGGMPITPKQLIAGIASFGIGIAEFLLLDMDMNAKMSIIFLTLSVAICFSVININGVPFHKFLIMGFKGVDKRPYNVKGMLNNDD
jgi:hypothetical protein